MKSHSIGAMPDEPNVSLRAAARAASPSSTWSRVVALQLDQALVGVDRRALQHLRLAADADPVVGPPLRRRVAQQPVDDEEQARLAGERCRVLAALDEEVVRRARSTARWRRPRPPSRRRSARPTSAAGRARHPAPRRPCRCRRRRATAACRCRSSCRPGCRACRRAVSGPFAALRCDEVGDARRAPAVVPVPGEEVRVVVADDGVVRRDDVALVGVVRRPAAPRTG